MIGKPVGSSIAKRLTAHAERKMEVSNYCSFSVMLHHRDQLPYELESGESPDVPPGVYFRTHPYGSVENYRRAKSYVHSWHFVSEEELLEARCFIDYDGGLICSIADLPNPVRHPNSSELVSCQKGRDMTTLSAGIMLVDNKGILPSVWLNVGGSVLRVDSQPSATRAEGLYVDLSNAVHLGDKLPKQQMYHYSIDEITQPKREGFLQAVFLSREAAVSYGDPGRHREMEHKEQLLILKKESEEATLQMEQYKNECSMHSMKLEEQRKELDHYRSMQAALRKDHFEERSHLRKDTVEFWKIAPLALTAVLAIVNLSN